MKKRKRIFERRQVKNGSIRMEPFSIEFEENGHYVVEVTLFEPVVTGTFMCWSEQMAREVFALLTEKFGG